MSANIIRDPAQLRMVQQVRHDMHRSVVPVRFGVGAQVIRRGNKCMVPQGSPDCPPRGRLCDMEKVGGFTTQTGGSSFSLTIEPDQSEYFEPWGVRATVFDNANPDLNHRVLFTAVTIGNYPQEDFHEVSPTAATRTGIFSDAWTMPDGDAVYIPWGTFGDANNKRALTIYGFVYGYSAGTTVGIHVLLYGNSRSAPPSCGCGVRKDGKGQAA